MRLRPTKHRRQRFRRKTPIGVRLRWPECLTPPSNWKITARIVQFLFHFPIIRHVHDNTRNRNHHNYRRMRLNETNAILTSRLPSILWRDQ